MKEFLMKSAKSVIFCYILFIGFNMAQTGTGAGGPLYVPANSTVYTDEVRTTASGSNPAGSTVLSVADASGFYPGDEILIITMTDPELIFDLNKTGRYEFATISSITAGTLNLHNPLQNDYNNTSDGLVHQVLKVNNYSDVTVAGVLTCSPWDGETGGVLAFRSAGSVTVTSTGVIEASGVGYRGGTQYGNSHGGGQGGESYIGLGGNGGNYSSNSAQDGAAGGGAAYAYYSGGKGRAGGGGGSTAGEPGHGSLGKGGSGGGGAGHAGSGGGAGYGSFGYGGHGYANQCVAENGGEFSSGNGCVNYTGGGGGGGGSYGVADLSRIYFGAGGGSGGRHDSFSPGTGGSGGGILLIISSRINNNGSILSNGGNGGNGSTYSGGGGGGAGGSLLLSAAAITNTGLISAEGGSGGNGYYGNPGGAGGDGIIRMDYHTLDDQGSVTPDPYTGGGIPGIYPVWISSTNDDAGPYPVETLAFGAGAPMQSVSLFYRVDGGSFTEVVLSTLNDTLFTGGIPGQQVNSTIEYYYYGTDGAANYYTPENAPLTLMSFQITGFPPENLSIVNNGDGSVDLTWFPPADITNLTGYNVYRASFPGFTPGPIYEVVTGLSDTAYTDTGLADFHTYHYYVEAVYDYDGIINTAGVSGSILVDDESLTTISGYVYLENQLNHANVKVQLVPISPSAQADSVFTDALGYFEKQIVPGVYDIVYKKSGYAEYRIIENTSVINDLDLGESTLILLGTNDVSGPVSGVWEGIVTVTGDVTIQSGDSLTILPGTRIQFSGNFNFSVNGYLDAVGAEGDSIFFTVINDSQLETPGLWQGIDFNDSSDDNSILSYAVVEYAVDGVYWNAARAMLSDSRIHHCSDNGMEVVNDAGDPVISQVNVHNNTNYGLYVYEGDPTVDGLNSHHNGTGMHLQRYAYCSITNSQFHHNNSHGIRTIEYAHSSFDNIVVVDNGSWGIRVDYSNITIDNSEISRNTASGIRVNNDNTIWSRVRISNTTIEENSGTGVYFRYMIREDSYIRNTTIAGNAHSGIYMEYYCRPEIWNNVIMSNSGYGIQINNNHYNNPRIEYNTISYNGNDGVYKANNGSPSIRYNTIYGNLGDGIEISGNGTEIITNNIIMNNSLSGLRSGSPIEVFEYNNIFENNESPVSNTGNLPVDSWDFISFNTNGDSADIYLNIVEPAGFVFSDTTDFRLSPGSACINAGDPGVLDPDGTFSDIGAFYFDFGNPQNLSVTGYSNNQVSLQWQAVERDSLLGYNVWFKEADSTSFQLFGFVQSPDITVTGLINNTAYDFSVSSVFPATESILSPTVRETPGEGELAFNPVAFNFTVDSDTVQQVLNVENTGSRDVTFRIPRGIENGSTRFTSNNGFLNIGDYPEISGLNEFTIECWIKRNNDGHFEFISKHYLRYSLYIDASNRFGIYKGYDASNSLYQNWSTDYVLPLNEWHHLAVTWSGNIIRFYADGDLVGEINDAVDAPISSSGYNLQFGRRADYGGYYLNGYLSEVRIWNVARTQEEIQSTIRIPLAGDEPGLVGYWPLHTDFLDYSPGQHHGTPYYQCYVVGSEYPAEVYPRYPFDVNQDYFSLSPAQQVDIPFSFWDTGVAGTSVYTTPVFTDIPAAPVIDYEISVTYGSSIPSTPVYFSPVAPTGLPYTIIVTDAVVDGEPLGIGDEIAVFDGELCVGAGVFDGNFNFLITAWQGDAGQGLEGFQTGNDIRFRIYDTSADLEAEVTPQYTIGNGTFGYGQFSAVNLDATVFQIQTVPVVGGMFNLISFNLLPRYTQATTIFGDMDSLRIVYNDMGAAYIPEFGINSLNEIDFRDGFHLFSSSADSIRFEGVTIDPASWFINVAAGRWNSIAYLGQLPVDVTLAFPDTLIDSVSIVQTFDGSVWIPELGVNTLGNMTPGRGYQIALNSMEDITFSYQTGGLTREDIPEPPLTEHFQFIPTGLPWTVVVTDAQLDGTPLDPGDEIAIFDGDLCVGAAVYQGDDKTVIPVWQSNDSVELEGFTAGENMTARVWLSAGGREISAEILPLNGITQFGSGDYALLSISGEKVIPSVYELKGNYPNPFNPATSIQYNLPERTQVELTIYTLSGQRVAKLVNAEQDAGYYSVEWQGLNDAGYPVASGIYLYRLKANGFSQSKKMLLLK